VALEHTIEIITAGAKPWHGLAAAPSIPMPNLNLDWGIHPAGIYPKGIYPKRRWGRIGRIITRIGLWATERIVNWHLANCPRLHVD